MEKRFLLTHRTISEPTFVWFDTEEEMQEYIEKWKIEDRDTFEKMEILSSREIK